MFKPFYKMKIHAAPLFMQWTTFTLPLFFLTACTGDSNRLDSKVVVQVNEDRLLAREFAEELAHRLRSHDALTVKDPRIVESNKREVVKDFIIESLAKSWSQQQGLFVRKESIESQIDQIRSSYPDDLAFRRALTEEGLSFDRWKSKLQSTLLQKLIIEKISSKKQEPTQKDLKDYYQRNRAQFKRPEQVHLMQIVLDSEVNAKHIKKLLRKRKAFSELAKKYSIAPEAKRGGDLGWVEKGVFPTFDKAFNLPRGRSSEVIKSPFGYHILLVKGKRKASTHSFQDVEDRVRRTLVERREQAVFSSWLEEQVRAAKVLKNEDLIAAIKVETKGTKR